MFPSFSNNFWFKWKWICDVCIFDELPRNVDPIISDDDDDNADIDQPFYIEYDDPSAILKKLNSENSTGLNFGHLNVCSLLKNLDEIKQFLKYE